MMDPAQRTQLAEALPTMTDAEVVAAVHDFRAALMFSGELGQAGENLAGLRDMAAAEIDRRRRLS
jgi:hypothetical protein